MTSQAQIVFNAAIALPEPDQVALVEELLVRLSPAADETTEDDFAAELDHRRSDFERGQAEAISWEQLRQEE